MPNPTSIDVVMRFLVDKSSQSAAKAALAELERAGIKFNETAKRFQAVQGGRFVGASAVSDIVRGVNATPERVWQTLIQHANQYNMGVQTAAQSVAKLGTYGKKTADELMELYNVYAKLGTVGVQTNQATAQSASQVAAAVSQVTKAAAAVPGGPFAGWKEAAADVAHASKTLGIDVDQAITMMAEPLGVTNQQLRQAVDLYDSMGNTAPAAFEATQAAALKSGREVRNFFRYSQQGVAGFMANQVGTELMRISKAMFTPVASYVKYFGQVSDASQDWLDAQKNIELSTIRIGGVMTSQLAPVLNTAADVVNRIADVFEKYPGLATAVTSIAGITFILGSALSAIGQIIIGATALQALSVSLGVGGLGAAGGAAAAAAGGVGAGIGIGAGATGLAASAMSILPVILPYIITAVAIYLGVRALGNLSERAQTRGGWRTGWSGAENAPLAEGIPGADWAAGIINNTNSAIQKLFGIDHAITNGPRFMPAGMKPEDATKKLLGLEVAIQTVGDEAEDTSNKLMLSQAAVDTFIQFQKQNADAWMQLQEEQQSLTEETNKRRVEIEKASDRDRIDIVEAAGEAILDAEERNGKDRARLVKNFNSGQADDWANLRRTQTNRLRDFAREEASMEAEYYANRLQTVQNSGLQSRRAEEDHQLRVLEMRREHEGNVEDLLDKQDAFGLLAENKRYEGERRREEEKYGLEVSRRNEDLALRLAEMEADFARQRALRQEEQALRVADEEVELQEKQALEKVQFDTRMAELDSEFGEELAKIEEQKQKRLDEVDKNQALELEQLNVDFQEQMHEADKNYQKAKARREAEFNDQLRQLDAGLLGETILKGQWYAAQSELLQSYINSWAAMVPPTLLPGYAPETTGVMGSKQTGGPINAQGLYYLHAGEYVVSQRDAALMRTNNLPNFGLGNSNKSFVLYQNFKFEGSFTEGDKQWFEDVAKDKAYEAFMEIIQ